MSSKIAVLSDDEVFEILRKPSTDARGGYFAMYSTWLGGITKNPQAMFVPIDDHIVHRGDGVFEAAKCVDGKLFGYDRHLERLERSAARIGLPLPLAIDEIRRISLETLRVANTETAMLRLYISRGPGSFTANPYESIGSQMYLVVTPYKPVAAEKYQKGVRIGLSEIGIKEGFFAQVKSCNYLANVLMKKESVDRGLDFTIAKDAEGFLAESSTENFAIISEGDEFVIPEFSRTLRGVTAVRVMELAEALVKDGRLRSVSTAKVHINDVLKAREAMMLGTTLDCLPVTEFEGRRIGDGHAGPIATELLRRLREDMASGPLAISP